jgi:hypothetical protein
MTFTAQKQTPAVGAGAAGDQENTHADFAIEATAVQKLQATTAAEFALRGFALLELADGGFLATRWNCCRPLPDLQAARAFLRQIGGAQ